MGQTHVFEQQHSFIASALYFDGYTRLERIHVSAGANPLYQGWLFVGEDGRRVPNLRFWFGCYRAGDVREYRIRAYQPVQPGCCSTYHGTCLDVSRNGYLGFYGATDVTPNWQLTHDEGAYEVTRSGQHDRLKILTQGKQNWRLNDPWCSLGNGIDFYMSMKVDKVGVAEF